MSNIKHLVDWKIELTGSYVHRTVRDLNRNPEWLNALPGLLPDFTSILQDILDLMRELGKETDLSYVSRPSIGEHEQNRDFHDWTALIDLNRDAWLALEASNAEDARDYANKWRALPYPLFKRLAFFSAANSSAILPEEIIDWLLMDGGQWLWSSETQREVMQLLKKVAATFSADQIRRLESAILQGPPRESDEEGFSDDEMLYRELEIATRLSKLESSIIGLSDMGRDILQSVRQKGYSVLSDDEQDEFAVWIYKDNELRQNQITPRERNDLMDWLQKNPQGDLWARDDWRQRCRDNFPTTATALMGLSRQNIWPVGRWNEALQAWSDEKSLRRSWRHIAKVLDRVPNNTLKELANSLSWWLTAQGKTFVGQEELFLALSNRLLSIASQTDETVDDSSTFPPDNFVSRVTEAVLAWWFRQELKDNKGLTDKIKPLFSELCNQDHVMYRSGRFYLAVHIISLFRVDRAWTLTHLIPFFDWEKSSVDAQAVWKGFLRAPRLYLPLLAEMKPYLLQTVRYHEKLGEHLNQYADFLAFSALEQNDIISTTEYRSAFYALPISALEHAADTLIRTLEESGDQRPEYWQSRTVPFFRNIWPKSREKYSNVIASSFATLCLVADEAFPDAINLFRNWLSPLTDVDTQLDLILQKDLCTKFPPQTLEYLGLILNDNVQWFMRNELRECLSRIEAADGSLSQQTNYIRLRELAENRGL